MEILIFNKLLSCLFVILVITKVTANVATVSDGEVGKAANDRQFSCYYCGTPSSRLTKKPIYDRLEQFYKSGIVIPVPNEYVIDECDRPANVSTIPTKKCPKSNVCMKWIIGEKKRRKFVFRGCIEDVMGGLTMKDINASSVDNCQVTEAEMHLEQCACVSPLCNTSSYIQCQYIYIYLSIYALSSLLFAYY